MKQAEKVLKHFEKHGKITSRDAFRLYNITRLSSIIFRLRQRGYRIASIEKVSKNKEGEIARYAEYIWKGEKG